MRSIVFLLLASAILSAQNAKQRKVFLDSTFAETTEDKHHYYRIIDDFNKKQLTYLIVDYYRSGNIYSQCYSTSNTAVKPIGLQTKYYENGNKKSAMTFEDGAPIGRFDTWHASGDAEMEAEYFYTTGIIPGGIRPTELKINQFWNADKKQTVTDGNGYCEIHHEKGCDEGRVNNGLKDSIWSGQDLQYKYTYVEMYKEGQLLGGTSTDEAVTAHSYQVIEEKPEYPGGVSNFYQYVQKNYRVPNIKGLQGKIIISFVIEKNGAVNDMRVLKSLGEAADNEAYRVLANSPLWKPGRIRGNNVRVLYSMPINISAGR